MTAAKGIRAGRAFVELSADNRKLVDALKKGQASMEHFGRTVRNVGLAAAAAGAAVLAPMAAMVKGFMTAGDQLDKMSQRTGETVENLSALKFAAEQSGTSIDALEGGLQRMQRTLHDAQRGSAQAAETFERLGLNAAAVAHLSPAAALRVLAERLSAVANENTRAALAMQVFGRSGAELIPLLNQGAAGIDDLMRQAHQMGIVMSTEAAAGAAQLTDAANRLTRIVRAAAFEIGHTLAGEITTLIDQIAEAATRTVQWVQENRQMVVWLAKTAATLTAAGLAMAAFGQAVRTVTGAIKAFTTVKVIALSLLGPKGWAVLAAGAVVAAGAVYGLNKAYEQLNATALSGEQQAAELKKIEDGARAAGLELDALAATMSAQRSYTDTPLHALGVKADEMDLDDFQRVKLQMQKDGTWDAGAAELLELYQRVITEKEQAMALDQRAAQLTENHLSAQERFNASVDELNDLRKRGLISQETYQRALEKQKDQLAHTQRDPAVEAEQRQLEALAQSVYERTRSPMERYKKEVEQLNRLVDQGLIDEDTYARAIERAKEAMQDLPAVDLDPATALQKTLAAVGGFSGFGRFGADAGTADRTASATESIAKTTQEMLRLQRDSEETVV